VAANAPWSGRLAGMDLDAELTINAYLDEWLSLMRTRVRRSTCATYQRMLDAYIRPHIGSLPLAELTTRRLDRLYVELLTGGGRGGRHLAQRTVAHTHAVLHKALADAVALELVPSNVASRAHVPKYDPDTPIAPSKLLYWDEDETRRFLAATSQDLLHGMWRVALGTGMRRGELLGLRWEDVDLVHDQLRVTSSLTEVDGIWQLGHPKSGRSRTLYLDASTAAALQREPRDRDTSGHDLVFTRSDGSPWSPSQVTDRWRDQWPRLARAGVPKIRLHATRHVHATLLLARGVPIKVVSERLGHTTIAMTMDIYAHVLPAMDRNAAEAIGLALGEAMS
jgi:integrase